MKVFIPVEGNNLNDIVDSHIGKGKHFIFFDTDKDTWEVIDNQFKDFKYSCEEVAKKAVEMKADVAIVKYICSRAFKILTEANVKIFLFQKGTVQKAIYLLKRNQLTQISKPNKKTRN